MNSNSKISAEWYVVDLVDFNQIYYFVYKQTLDESDTYAFKG